MLRWYTMPWNSAMTKLLIEQYVLDTNAEKTILSYQ